MSWKEAQMFIIQFKMQVFYKSHKCNYTSIFGGILHILKKSGYKIESKMEGIMSQLVRI